VTDPVARLLETYARELEAQPHESPNINRLEARVRGTLRQRSVQRKQTVQRLQVAFALAAGFAYANTALTREQQRSDVTTIGPPTAAGLQLVKTVDRTAARSGDVITYTIAFANLSSDALSGIKITDATPAYTVFQSASCGAMPSAQLVCTVSVQPAVGGTGRVEWSLVGPLGSGLGGQVVLVVKLQ